ncbi:endonuclease V [Sporosarcina sp. G11-34]|uniref:endonuclease V n=1 Tax=Sporosarcina sp. G11-34 TaxID=2849605 RepID=UPI0022A9A35E|nr:endonuclease V [Sporosarcina sp. G11-34]MCZ2258352.1 endonuclease V [Sporosarcina sp. G11-34]
MKIEDIHPLGIESDTFTSTQVFLSSKIDLNNVWTVKDIKYCAGVDLAYWVEGEIEWGVCSIVVIDYETKNVVEKTYSVGQITVPYIPGYLAFRELPLVLEAAQKISNVPDLFIFDGNGYLHPRHIGIATHAAFFLNKPTIGVAKSYFKIDNADFEMPENQASSYKEIKVQNEVYGRVLRTHKDVKPIFISCGNEIDLETTTEVILNLIDKESRLPIPVRLADLESRLLRRHLSKANSLSGSK